MAVIIGSARVDENGKYIGGKAGDQTGKEVSTQNYYLNSKGWNLLRAKDYAIGNRLANAMQQACDNDNIGYDQGINDRTSVIDMLKKYGTLGNIKELCEADCSSLVRACIIQATGKDVGNFNTSSEVGVVMKSGLFLNPVFKNGIKLYNGDILVTKTKGHTVIVTKGNPLLTLSSTNPFAEPATLLKKGQKGEGVMWLQWYLVEKKMFADSNTIEIDGDFGSKTEEAVKKFQRENNLTVDGIIGKQTREVLKQ